MKIHLQGCVLAVAMGRELLFVPLSHLKQHSLVTEHNSSKMSDSITSSYT